LKLNLETEYDRIKARDYLAKLEEKKAFIELKEVRKARSNQANRYLHAIIAEWAMQAGYTLEEMKCAIKAALSYYYVKGGVTMYKETSKMDTEELSIFIDKLRKLAAEQGVDLMSPESFEQGGWRQVEKMKEQHKRHI